MQWNPKSIRNLNLVATVFSGAILLVVVFMRKIHFQTAIDFSFLPFFHSSLNGLTGLILIAAYIQIRKGNVQIHKKLMTTAICFSLLFLISYVVYHTTSEEVRFCKEGWIRILYFILLISHVILSGISFPFIVFTYIRGLTGQYARHKTLARYVFPIWLYICISGPLCFILLFPCFKR